MESPYDEVSPCMFYLQTTSNSAVIAKLNPRLSASEALAVIGPVFRKYNPEQPFEYHFVEEEYTRKFGNEQRTATLASFFAALAIFIAIPSAYFLMFSWLQNYQYRTGLSWWFFALPAAGAMLITLLTVSFQSINAALTNPVKSLRSE